MQRMLRNTLALFALCASTGALAHTVWLRQNAARPDTFRLYFGGHAGKIEPYDGSRLDQVQALDARGRKLAVNRSGTVEPVLLTVAGTPVLITAHFDNGIHSRRAQGPSVKKPMNEVDGAVSAVNAQKYHKTIVRWGAQVLTRPVGQVFEVVPMSAAAPVAGKPMRVQVRIDGKPAAGVKIGRGEDSGDGVTGADGVATFVPQSGFNKLWAGQRTQVKDDPRYTELSYEYALGFDVP